MIYLRCAWITPKMVYVFKTNFNLIITYRCSYNYKASTHCLSLCSVFYNGFSLFRDINLYLLIMWLPNVWFFPQNDLRSYTTHRSLCMYNDNINKAVFEYMHLHKMQTYICFMLCFRRKWTTTITFNNFQKVRT